MRSSWQKRTITQVLRISTREKHRFLQAINLSHTERERKEREDSRAGWSLKEVSNSAKPTAYLSHRSTERNWKLIWCRLSEMWLHLTVKSVKKPKWRLVFCVSQFKLKDSWVPGSGRNCSSNGTWRLDTFKKLMKLLIWLNFCFTNHSIGLF